MCHPIFPFPTPTRRLYLAMLLCSLLLAKGSFAQPVRQIAMPTITVSDLDRILPFYTGVLGFKLTGITEENSPQLAALFGLEKETSIRVATLQVGREQIRLLDFTGDDPGRPVPPDSRSNDLWFQHIAIVTGDMSKAYERLRRYRVQHVSTAPQTLPDYLPAAAGISAFYFRDPDGHNLEIIAYPQGKGQARWQQCSQDLFLGIDHSAIAVADTERSLSFYQQLLGLELKGKSENYGPEQEHLNQVFGARLDITGLGAPQGSIGLEFLQYLSPPGGRPYPTDSRPTDHWHWHLTFLVDDLEVISGQLRSNGYTPISREITGANASALFPGRSTAFRDPDGHVILLTEITANEQRTTNNK